MKDVIVPHPDSQVALAVQLEDGTRKLGTFSSTSPLWSVLSELGIAVGAGQDEAMEPVIVFMRREVGGRGRSQSIDGRGRACQ